MALYFLLYSTCCPYGPLTALPAILGCIGSAFNFTAVFAYFLWLPYGLINDNFYSAYTDGIRLFSVGESEDSLLKFAGVIGYVSSSIGSISTVLSIVLSCKTCRASAVNLLGSVYIALGVTSALMFVALASESCTNGCSLATGAIFAIVASPVYIGAGVSTFYLNKRVQTG